MGEPIILDVELSPVARRLGVTYVHDVELGAGQVLGVGDSVCLRDEGGASWTAVVLTVEVLPRGLGRKYRLSIEPVAPVHVPRVGAP